MCKNAPIYLLISREDDSFVVEYNIEYIVDAYELERDIPFTMKCLS